MRGLFSVFFCVPGIRVLCSEFLKFENLAKNGKN